MSQSWHILNTFAWRRAREKNARGNHPFAFDWLKRWLVIFNPTNRCIPAWYPHSCIISPFISLPGRSVRLSEYVYRPHKDTTHLCYPEGFQWRRDTNITLVVTGINSKANISAISQNDTIHKNWNSCFNDMIRSAFEITRLSLIHIWRCRRS